MLDNEYDFKKPKDLTEREMLLGLFSVYGYIPKYEDIDNRFKKDSEPFVKVINDWFFNGLANIDDIFTAKEGIDLDKALNHVRAVLNNMNIKHEHKTAGCAFLLSNWVDLKK